MKRFFLTLVATITIGQIFGQSYQIGHVSMTLIDSSRQNRAVPCEIYYPADVAGDNVSFSKTLKGKVPAISFGHGFVMKWDAYQNIWEAVVPNGYIVAFPTSESSFSPSHEELGKDLSFILKKLLVLGNTPGSIFYNKVDTMNCVMGHSMGGGSAFIAAGNDPGIKAIATLSAAETKPSAIAAAKNIKVPALVFAGLNDCITPAKTNQLPMYDGLSSKSKHYIGIKGGSHCLMADKSFTCSFGEGTCKPKPEITREEQHAIINKYLIPWLNYYLKHSDADAASFEKALKTDSAIIYQ
jgi:predicted dienelactone hydrolase